MRPSPAAIRSPRPAARSIRLDAATRTSTGDELAIGLDGVAWYLPAGATLTPTAPTYVVTA